MSIPGYSHWLGKLECGVPVDGSTEPYLLHLHNGDVNEDNTIGLLDLAALKQSWGSSPPSIPNADLNGDGSVGLADLSIIKQNWGRSGDH
jgi:hypothetical protein